MTGGFSDSPRALPTLAINMITRDGMTPPRDAVRALNSAIAYADEVVVIDTGSVDDTPRRIDQCLERERMRRRAAGISKPLSGRIHRDTWRNDFAYHRNQALVRTESDCVLWLDDDDELTTGTARRIPGMLSEGTRYAWLFCVIGPEFAHAGVHCRLFPNLPGVEWREPVHEQILPSLVEKGVKAGIEHNTVVWHHGYGVPFHHPKRREGRSRNDKIARAAHSRGERLMATDDTVASRARHALRET